MPPASPDQSTPQRQQHLPRPELLPSLGLLGWLGVAALVAGTLVAPFYVPGYDRLADTISDLVAGRSEIIMDVALYGFAIGIMATALAAAMVSALKAHHPAAARTLAAARRAGQSFRAARHHCRYARAMPVA